MTTNIFETIQEFYPGMRCQFKEDWHNYCAGNIVIVANVIKNVYPGGVHKLIFDDGYVMSSETAQKVLAVQHLPFIYERLETNETRLSELREGLEAVTNYPQQMKDIFGDFARDIKPEEIRVKTLNTEIERLEGLNEFLKKYERAIFVFVGKYVKEMPTNNKECSWFGRQGVFDMTVSMMSVKVNNRKIFDFYDYRHPTKYCVSDDAGVNCIQRAFESELNAVGINCELEDEFGL